MPATMIIVNNGNADPSTGRWRAGEATLADVDDRPFGWHEMPKQFDGEFTVAQVNSIDVNAQNAYSVVKLTDGGTINVGLDGGPFEVSAGDVLVLQYTDTFRYWSWFDGALYGDRTDEFNEKRNFQWRISDKEPQEVEAYMERHSKVIEMTTVAGPDPSGLRRIEAENLYVTASGDNSWTQEGVDEVIAEWNTRYPDSDLHEYQPFTVTTFFFEGTFTPGQADEFEDVVTSLGLDSVYAQRRWYINSQGMTALADNDGFMSTTAQELGQVFRDGLLD